jgi:tripartite-type tricarboxylate transporter receptor subunit TctC
MYRSIRTSLSLVVAGLLCAVSPFAAAQAPAYPANPIQLVIPYPAGGSLDATARMLANHFSETFGKTVLVDARPGGNTVIGAQHVARARADGYTLLLTGNSTMSLLPLTFEGTLPFDTVKDFVPIGMIARLTMFVAVSKDSPYKTIQDVIDDAKRRPRAVSVANNGVGSLSHLAPALLASRAGVELNHITYKGYAAALPDLITGRVDMLMSDVGSLLPALQAGSVRLLAVSSSQRSPIRPEVPTVAESGIDPAPEGWLGVFAPAGTPEEAVTKLRTALRAYIQTDKAREALGKFGWTADASGGEALHKRIIDEQKVFQPVVQAAGVGKAK